MSADIVTSIPTATLPPGQSEDPINVISDRLGQARATLDLIHTGLENDVFVESLFNETLAHAVHSAILRIDEAMTAADAWNTAEHS